MQNQSDAQFLRQYAAERSEAAFGEIVARHAGLVYSAALRQLESPELARDVAQSVFTDLARKAPSLADKLSGDASLAGWLYRSTRFAARDAARGDRRRQARERQVMEHFDATAESAPQWEQVRPVLDEAMAELSDEDREAVLLRYFAKQDLHAVGQALGVSDDAAQKRVSRALERLRAGLANRGVTTTAGALSALLVAETVSFAPAGLAATLSTAALAGTTLTTAATATATKAIAMTTLQKTLIAATFAAAVGTGIYEARQASILRTQVQALQQQQAPMAKQIKQLQQELDDTTNRLVILNIENGQVKTNSNELLRLRGMVAQLRKQLESQPVQNNPQREPAKETSNTATHAPGSYVSRDDMAYVGYATPEAALETFQWVLIKGTYDQAKEGLGSALSKGESNDAKNREQFESSQQKVGSLFQGMQILAKKVLTDDKIEFKVKLDYRRGPRAPEFFVQPMVKVGDQWKLGGSTRSYQDDWEKSGVIQSFVP